MLNWTKRLNCQSHASVNFGLVQWMQILEMLIKHKVWEGVAILIANSDGVMIKTGLFHKVSGIKNVLPLPGCNNAIGEQLFFNIDK